MEIHAENREYTMLILGEIDILVSQGLNTSFNMNPFTAPQDHACKPIGSNCDTLMNIHAVNKVMVIREDPYRCADGNKLYSLFRQRETTE